MLLGGKLLIGNGLCMKTPQPDLFFCWHLLNMHTSEDQTDYEVAYESTFTRCFGWFQLIKVSECRKYLVKKLWK